MGGRWAAACPGNTSVAGANIVGAALAHRPDPRAVGLDPLVDANFRTDPIRAQRAVIGESMGGYGATMLAARHPDRFTAVSSLSGAVDTNWLLGTAPSLQSWVGCGSALIR